MSKRLPALTPKDVFRALTQVGFYLHHTTGSHYCLKHPEKPGLRVTLPWHNRDLKRGTLAAVIEQAGYSIQEFVKLL
jgi:predicted RNA binding protein YcfA (HicA-like mRNA interferase family)